MTRWILVRYPIITMLAQQVSECSGHLESGGILIGSYRGPHLEISGYTLPGNNDLRLPYKFVKQDSAHQQSAFRAWYSSGRKDTYIGEWHTHPVGMPEPSTTDTRSWRAIVRKTRRPMVFAIASPASWKFFWCQIKFVGVSIKPMISTERGQTGVVFRSATSGRLRGLGFLHSESSPSVLADDEG